MYEKLHGNIITELTNKMNDRERLKDKKRIVIKIGSSSLTHAETGKLNLRKLEILVRELGDLRNQGKDVVLVSSGAIAVGVQLLDLKRSLRSLVRNRHVQRLDRPDL